MLQINALTRNYNEIALQGALHYKQVQDTGNIQGEAYVRHAEEMPADDADTDRKPYRIIICMTSAMSRRLSSALYVQSDIAFKRVKMWFEFEIAVWDRELKTSIGMSIQLEV